MPSFQSQVDHLFPQIDSFHDFSGTQRVFDFYIREMPAGQYTIVAQDTHNNSCHFEMHLNANPGKTLAKFKMDIVHELRSPLNQPPTIKPAMHHNTVLTSPLKTKASNSARNSNTPPIN